MTSDKAAANFSDRSLLKNLGHWLGMITLAKNKPILYTVSIRDPEQAAFVSPSLLLGGLCMVMAPPGDSLRLSAAEQRTHVPLTDYPLQRSARLAFHSVNARSFPRQDLEVKSLLLEAYVKGQQELLYVVPFVAKVLESSLRSMVSSNDG